MTRAWPVLFAIAGCAAQPDETPRDITRDAAPDRAEAPESAAHHEEADELGHGAAPAPREPTTRRLLQ